MAEKAVAPEQIPLAQIGAFVPFPTVLLDEWMPKLKDTEWRLLCVIVRQTLGWQSGEGRKRRDWMSQKQLMARTGRNSAALSAAIDSLIRKNLIECCNVQGEPLVTPRQRRNYRGRIYFSLASSFIVNSAGTSIPPLSGSARHSPIHDLPSIRLYKGWASVGQIATQLNYPTKSEVQNANGTKETGEQKKPFK